MAQPPSNEYAPNFVFPIRDIESERVKLTLFIVRHSNYIALQTCLNTHRLARRFYPSPLYQPELHAKEFFEGTRGHPELFNYHFPHPYDNVEDLVEDFIEKRMHQDPFGVAFAVFDKTGGHNYLYD